LSSSIVPIKNHFINSGMASSGQHGVSVM